MCNQDVVVDEFLRVLGCETSDGTKESVTSAAKRWSAALQGMAINMTANNPFGDAHAGHMAIDAGYTDNSGLGPILAEHLKNASAKGHVTVLISNKLGDHQMETYFESTPNDGGMICKDGEAMEEQFDEIKEIYRQSFEDVDGKYIPRDGEKTCAIRLASAVFFKGHPPEHHRFKDKRIPDHITYAYKRAATIIKNEDFYKLPDNGTYTIDLLFLMSNAPVATASFPEAGSESYVGLANAMELAMDELSTMFPEMLRGETKSSNREDPQVSPEVSADGIDELDQNKHPKKYPQSILDQMTDLIANTDKLSRHLSHMTPLMQAKIFGNTAADHGEEH